MTLYCASVPNEFTEGNISVMFSDENAFRLICYLASCLAATEGTCSGLGCSSWSIPGSSMSDLVTLSLHWNLPISSSCSSTLVLAG